MALVIIHRRKTRQRGGALIVAMTVATGAIYGMKVRLALRLVDMESHLVISKPPMQR